MGHDIGDLNLWAIGFDDAGRAREFRAELLRVESLHGMHVNDAIVITRRSDGSFTDERDCTPSVTGGMAGFGLLGFIVGLVVLQPLGGAVIGAALGGAAVGAARLTGGIDEDFVRDVQAAMRPGTSALFLLTTTNNPDAVERDIRGIGGTVLKTNVTPELERRVREALAEPRPAT